MNSLTDVNLQNACRDYVVSNTPLFLVGRLKEDPAVQQMSREFSSSELLSGIRESVPLQPTEVLDQVRPYAYLVALWLKRSLPELRAAAELDAPYTDWFAYIGTYLVDTLSPVSISEIDAASQQEPSLAIEGRSELPPEMINLIAQ
jgi:hypothetical protein